MRMTSKTLENLLRIKINGPSDLSKFTALKYAKKWKTSGRQLTDDPQHVTKSKSKCHFTDDDKDMEDELESSKKSYFTESTVLIMYISPALCKNGLTQTSAKIVLQ